MEKLPSKFSRYYMVTKKESHYTKLGIPYSYLKDKKFPKFFSRKLTLKMLQIQMMIVEAITKIFFIILALDYIRFENGI